MGCFLTGVALLAPRILMFFILLLTDWFSAAFETALWPVLGFLFMPYTTLAWMAAQLRGGGVSGGWLVLVIIAVVADLGGWGSGGAFYNRR